MVFESGSPAANSLKDWPAATPYQLEQQYYKRDNEQDVDIRTQHMEADKAQQPKDKQNYKDRPQHRLVLPII